MEPLVRPSEDRRPLVSICIPHYQVKQLMTLCLRAIRRHTPGPTYEVIVVDNGSRDDSLEWLRSLDWLRLIERGEETPENWVHAMATALDIGLAAARGDYYLIMHSDTIVRHPSWLRSLVGRLEKDARIASAGSGKLDGRGPLALFLKNVTDVKRLRLWWKRTLLGKSVQSRILLARENCPRDYCALYRAAALRENNVSFVQKDGYTAGETAYRHLKDAGYLTSYVPATAMARLVDHVAHASGAITPDRDFLDRRTRRTTRRRLDRLYRRPDVVELLRDESLDR